jgi:Zn-finger protein
MQEMFGISIALPPSKYHPLPGKNFSLCSGRRRKGAGPENKRKKEHDPVALSRKRQKQKEKKVMKKVLAAVGIASLMATSAFAVTFTGTNAVKAGVVASKHNMNLYSETTKDTQGRVCAFCHTPHHALADTTGGLATYLPLWSHKLTTQTTYTPYFTPTVNVDLANELQGPTILCMSCHDGAIAIDEHYGNGLAANKLADDGFNGTAIGLANDTNNAGATNLGNDHPIGFLYSEAVTNHGTDINPATTTFNGGTKTIADQLTAGFMTCATCHDVHNKDNAVNTVNANVNYFLLGDQNGSAFCLTCHNK